MAARKKTRRRSTAKRRGAKRKPTKRRAPKRRRKPVKYRKPSKRRRAPKRKFATSHHRYTSEVAARNRRKDIRQYGSIAKARTARRDAWKREQEYEMTRPPYQWGGWWWYKGKYYEHNPLGSPSPRSTTSSAPHSPPPRPAPRHRRTDRDCVRLRKVIALTHSPIAGEAASARLRAKEMMDLHGITEDDCK